MIEPSAFQRLARYNVWMNDRIYAICAEIEDSERKADRGAFFGSLHGTLNHLLYGDRAWMRRFTGVDYELRPIGEDLFDDFEVLRAARAEMDRAILDWTDGVSRDWLAADVTWTSKADGQTRVQPAWLLVLHMFNHQAHHRGQLTTLLSQMGQDIGNTDLPWTPEPGESGGV